VCNFDEELIVTDDSDPQKANADPPMDVTQSPIGIGIDKRFVRANAYSSIVVSDEPSVAVVNSVHSKKPGKGELGPNQEC
jgi:hypothetical protein